MHSDDQSIHDEELLLFHWGEGLAPERREQITRALAEQPAVSARLVGLRAALELAAAEPVPEPEPGLERRILEGLKARTLAEASAYPARRAAAPLTAKRRSRTPWRLRAFSRIAVGAAAALLLSVGFLAGRHSGPDAVQVDADRIYAAMLIQHLDASQRGLMTAVNSGHSPVLGTAELAGALLANNRLYLAAAEHQGDRRTADLLQRLEPLLIELANPAPASDIEDSTGLREYVQRSDLIFELRAAQAGFVARRSTTST
jgi:hypothetical protein